MTGSMQALAKNQRGSRMAPMVMSKGDKANEGEREEVGTSE